MASRSIRRDPKQVQRRTLLSAAMAGGGGATLAAKGLATLLPTRAFAAHLSEAVWIEKTIPELQAPWHPARSPVAS